MQTGCKATDEINARMAAARLEEEAAQSARRVDLLGKLRAAGLTRIEARYDGYGDSGNVVDITGGMGNELEEAVSTFVWDFAYGRHPGFENSEGGQGTLTWDTASDRITLRHEDNYIEVDVTLEEDL